jgi:PAS domain S-box-containing protein
VAVQLDAAPFGRLILSPLAPAGKNRRLEEGYQSEGPVSEFFSPISPAGNDTIETRGGDYDAPRLGATIERAPVGIAHFDVDGRFAFVNPQLCAIFGFSRDEMLAMRFHEISFPDDLPRCLALTSQLATGAIPKYTIEKRFSRRDGGFVYVRVIVSAIRDGAGAVAYFLGIVEDLSEFWAAEEGRRDAEERLKVALLASDTGIYRYDFKSQSLDWANGLAAIFGFPENEPLQSLERLLGAIHPDDLPAVLTAYDQSASQGADFSKDFRIVLPDGSIRWITDKARLTRDPDGTPRYLTGACIDVTHLVEAREAERAARAEAERARGLRDDMLAIVAHDLRNPVHTIMLSAGAMEDFDLSPEEERQQLALIRRSAGGMDRLIRDLLDVTQIETGRLAIHATPLSIDSVVSEAIALCEKHAESAGLVIEASVPPGVARVKADRARILQVIGNLLGNAIKFTDRGGRIIVSVVHANDVVQVSVEDTGRGMSRDELPRVFEAYWQADPKSRKGVGLGLAIVRGIVVAHGGTIEVESSPAVGSTFRFTLPVA